MNNKRCNNCSFLNFAMSEICKRCGAPLSLAKENESQPLQFAPSESYSGQNHYSPSNSFTGQSQPYFEHSETSNSSKRRLGVVTWLSIVCLVAVIGFRLYMTYGSTSAIPESAWRMFTPDDKAFSVLMPGEPKSDSSSMITKSGPKLWTTKYELDTDGGYSFVVVYIHYSVFPSNMTADLAFDEAIDSMSREVTILSRKNITLDGHPAMELDLGRPAGGGNTGTYKGTMRLYYAPPRVYAVGADGPDSRSASATRTKFLDSFKIN